ncbi:alpha/beta fold hydrolase [Mesorhizobium microcysteis]|uniref:Alpha/beta fold hydrolase n=1 Tax=Neoaquamicrobium microcysteis TaxID=2682781 RepID=A0A5D4GYP3_9HYPH|nr:alpha/beta fold hydrolase [Mesorhizobium microcysteis]TYR33528.1 alpha/beta fold hydrolase [Mesorhizobium microcysteis]
MNARFEVLAGAEPFSAKGDGRGALVLHGFTGCPQSMRPLAEAFAKAGFTVELPRLPGHGTAVEDMVNYRWSDWTEAADAAWHELADRTDSVVVAGLSMGGSLTLWLASRYPQIRGIVLVNPAAEADDFTAFVEGAKAVLAAGEHYLPAVAGDVADPNSKELGYDRSPAAGLISLVEGIAELKAGLPDIRIPALLLHSPQDHVIPPGSAELLRKTLGGPVDHVELERSFHVATIDYDRDEINRRAVAFAENVSA